MKNKLKVIVLIICVLCLCGCGTKEKESISSKQFLEPLEDSFTVNDIKDNYSFATEAYLATYQKNEIKMIYTKGETTYDIKSVFADEVSNVLSAMNKSDKVETSKGDNWEKLVASNEQNYYYLIRVDNTYIYSSSSLNSKAALKKILKQYGYR